MDSKFDESKFDEITSNNNKMGINLVTGDDVKDPIKIFIYELESYKIKMKSQFKILIQTERSKFGLFRY